MSLIKLAHKSPRILGLMERILVSPSSKIQNCFTGLKDEGETFLGYNKDGNFIHFFQKNGKNSIINYTGTRLTEGPANAVGGIPFHGHLQVNQNRNMKKALKKFNEIYKFKTKSSAKRFRDQLKAFD